jgi:flavin-binding protein dodecin
MKQVPDNILEKVKKLGHDVKEQLKAQGIIVPSKTTDGTIRVGHYRIKKTKSGFYDILDYSNDIVIDKINLPQTAAIIANKLALGKYLDDDMLMADRRYGHALFEEELHDIMAEKSLKSKNIDRAEVMYTKRNIAKYKKEQYRKTILVGFEKLMRFR